MIPFDYPTNPRRGPRKGEESVLTHGRHRHADTGHDDLEDGLLGGARGLPQTVIVLVGHRDAVFQFPRRCQSR